MKNTCKIKIHLLFYVILFLSILTGKFKLFITITIITIIHELGHIMTSLIFDWKIEKILIMPISILTIYNIKINIKSKEELLVTIMGPIFQLALFLFIKDSLVFKYNLILLLFNLLPIYPLDGSKIFKLFLYNFIPFKLTETISIYLSLILLLSLILFTKINLIIIFIFIIFTGKIINIHMKRKYIFNKFLFERYLYQLKFKKQKIIKNKNNFYKNYCHNIINKNKIESEREFLNEMFDNKRVL